MNNIARFTTIVFSITALALLTSACGKKQAAPPPLPLR